MSPETPPRAASLAQAASAAPAASATPFDPVALARLRELDPEGRHGVVQRVMVAFETSLSRMLGQLEAERAGGHADVVSSVAHTLKSSAASVGAVALAQTCAEVERRLRAGEAGSLAQDIERLLMAGEDALVTVRAMLRA